MGPQGPPALRCVGLAAVTSLRAGPSYGLPGQAPEQRDWVKIQPATSSKVGQHSTGVDIAAGQRWVNALEDVAIRREAVLFLVSEGRLAEMNINWLTLLIIDVKVSSHAY